MSDNIAETAGSELKKWLAQLQKIMAMLEAQEKAMKAEQKAIGDKALSSHKEMVAKAEKADLMKQIQEIKEGIKNTPDTPGKDGALDQVSELENDLQNDELEVNLDDPDKLQQKPADPHDLEVVADVKVDDTTIIDIGENSVGDDLAISSPKAGGRARSQSFGEKLTDKDALPGSTLDALRNDGDELDIVKDVINSRNRSLTEGSPLNNDVGKLDVGKLAGSAMGVS